MTPERSADEPVSVQHVLALKSFPLLADVEPDELAALVARTRTRRFATGENLGGEGGPSAHFVLDGELDQVRGGVRGRRYGPRSLAGATDVLAGGGKATLVARSAGETLEIDRGAFLEVLAEQFGLLRAIVAEVASRWMESPAALRADGVAVGDVPSATDLAGRIALLHRASLLGRVPVRVLGYIARESQRDRLGDGATLWRAGEAPGRIVVVEAGTVHAVPERGREVALGPGTILGLAESLASKPRSYDAVARGEVTLVGLDVPVLFDILEDEPEAVIATLTRASRYLARQRET